MPKKQQRNAFYYFMIDKQQQLREQGKIVSLKDMPIIASAEWNVSTSHTPLLERVGIYFRTFLVLYQTSASWSIFYIECI